MGKTPTERIEAFKKKERVNTQCAICSGYVTTVLMQHHSFVCSRCSGILREEGFTVKGISMTNWNEADAEKICNGGNRREREELCGAWDGNELAVNADSPDSAVRKFVHAKYVDKKWAVSGGTSRGGSGRHHHSHHEGQSHHGHDGGHGRSGRHGGGSRGDSDEAKQLASMLPDVTEARAAELIAQHGSLNAAMDAYFNSSLPNDTHSSSAPSKPPLAGSKKSGKRRSSSSRRHPRHSEDNFTAMDEPSPTQARSLSSMRLSGLPVADAPPAPLGEASPGRVHGLAGMVGMAARGELGGEFDMGMGQFGSAPGQCPGGMQHGYQQGWGQPGSAGHCGPGGPCGGQGMCGSMGPGGACQSQFHSAPGQLGNGPHGCQTPTSWQSAQQGLGVQQGQGMPQGMPQGMSQGMPQGMSQGMAPQSHNPMNPFAASASGCGGQSGQMSQPQGLQQQQQALLQQLLQKKQQLQEEMQRQLQLQQQGGNSGQSPLAMPRAGAFGSCGGSCGGCCGMGSGCCGAHAGSFGGSCGAGYGGPYGYGAGGGHMQQAYHGHAPNVPFA